MLLSLQFVFSQPIDTNTIQTLTLAGDPYGYDNEYQDDEDGTVYLRARNYDAKSGEFISQDSYGFFNRYLSFSANPVGDVDPSGHAAVSFFTQHYWHKKSNWASIVANIVPLIVGEGISGVIGYTGRYYEKSIAIKWGASMGALSGGLSSLSGIFTQAGLRHPSRVWHVLGKEAARNSVNFLAQTILGAAMGELMNHRFNVSEYTVSDVELKPNGDEAVIAEKRSQVSDENYRRGQRSYSMGELFNSHTEYANQQIFEPAINNYPSSYQLRMPQNIEDHTTYDIKQLENRLIAVARNINVTDGNNLVAQTDLEVEVNFDKSGNVLSYAARSKYYRPVVNGRAVCCCLCFMNHPFAGNQAIWY
ncbi:RHS repeat-associated core domain-containing protein [Fangia hongkongensis]|uniref:RHS repeat-associated core domain-containing protein n=3 Tax=Fangia hongkongensis TaxID=270495 RepID=UPI001469EC7F|nr:RHS repeat-associated core domain-containing protein [Fangia hongkongensis]